ncbi:MAG: hypothetical protein ACE5NG_12580 [bacterium]
MADIESISVLRQTDRLDKVSQSQEPLYVTKNGKAYLVVLSPGLYEEIIKERDHYREAFEREKEIRELVSKVERSRKNIDEGQYYSEEEFDKMMDKILS